MGYHCFELEVTEGVAHLKLSRPDQLNSLCAEFWSELPAIVTRLSDQGATRALVISSVGRHFTAGLDLGLLATGIVGEEGEIGRRRANFRLLIRQLQDALTCLELARMPVLAAVQGGCVGGGIDLITACDMRYCSEDAFF